MTRFIYFNFLIVSLSLLVGTSQAYAQFEVPDTRPAVDEAMRIVGSNNMTMQEKSGQLSTLISQLPEGSSRMVYEYRILVAVLQRSPIPNEEAAKHRGEIAKTVFSNMFDRYEHADYVRTRDFSSGNNMPDTMLPRAAFHLASAEVFLFDRPKNARELLLQGMDMVQETRDLRIETIKNQPRPVFNPDKDGPNVLRTSDYVPYEYRLQKWEKQQEIADRGDVYNPSELRMTQSMVKRYGESYGKQDPWEVRNAMQELIDLYPDSPISVEAHRVIEIAEKLTERLALKQIENLPADFTEPIAVLEGIASDSRQIEGVNNFSNTLSQKTSLVPRNRESQVNWFYFVVPTVLVALAFAIYLRYRGAKQSIGSNG